MQTLDQTSYKSPFSAAYWRAALADFKRPRNLAFAAMMIAACVALSYVPSIRIDLTDVYSASVTWGFLARSVCSMVCGPVTAVVFGLAEDTISFLIKPNGVYFPGYALTTMLGNLIYALFLYRVRFGIGRVFLAKLLTNVMNVFLGSLWSAILSTKGYWVYVSTRAVKNAIMLPVQTAMLCILFAALTPILHRMRWLPAESGWNFSKRKETT